MWQRGRVTKEQVKTLVPHMLTQEEYDDIISHPQNH
ncbi:XkdX family protein [Salimicrobium album]